MNYDNNTRNSLPNAHGATTGLPSASPSSGISSTVAQQLNDLPGLMHIRSPLANSSSVSGSPMTLWPFC